MNYYFSPNLTYADFTAIVSQLCQATDGEQRLTKLFNRAQFDAMIDLKGTHVKLAQITDADLSLAQVTLFKQLYAEVKKYSAFIEEERRLLYVGMTRSKSELLIDAPAECTPLFSELDLDQIQQV